ncbi:MAG: NAD(P)/FAD-dependent oxidoreductase [Bacilli bacterium]|nr:NAD(P)/FAD-dependent oxidoreductase [Bacilli bacterium]
MNCKHIIIGGGPIGLYLASKLDNYLLLEASNELGGQITHLYPEKEIVDIKGIDSIKAKDYISLLISKIDLKNVHLNEKVIGIENNKVITSKGEYFADNIFIVTGLGFSSPRKLGIENEEKCKNILYSLADFKFLKDKKVAIFGGGDSALDWAKEISALSDNVSLIHRRTEFRGNPDTIKGCKNLKLYLPYVPYSLKYEGDICKSITIKKVSEALEEFIELDVDFVLVNYGQIAEQNNFPFEKEGAFLKVNEKFEVAPHVYALGDGSTYENKKRRIAPGNEEVDKLLKLID